MAGPLFRSGVSPHSSKMRFERAVVDADAQRDAPLAAAGRRSAPVRRGRGGSCRVDAYLVDVLRRHGLRRFPGRKWMSATRGRRIPSARNRSVMSRRFSASRTPCAVRRTMGAPARRCARSGRRRPQCRACVGVGHRLHRHGMRAADRAGADADFVRRYCVRSIIFFPFYDTKLELFPNGGIRPFKCVLIMNKLWMLLLSCSGFGVR